MPQFGAEVDQHPTYMISVNLESIAGVEGLIVKGEHRHPGIIILQNTLKSINNFLPLFYVKQTGGERHARRTKLIK